MVAKLSALFWILLFVILIIRYSPKNRIKREFHVELSPDHEVIKYSGRYGYAAKISIDEQDVEGLKAQLTSFLGSDSIQDLDTVELPYMKSDAHWWDLDPKNIIIYYHKAPEGRNWIIKMFSSNLFAFISKDDSGHYYLYLKH